MDAAIDKKLVHRCGACHRQYTDEEFETLDPVQGGPMTVPPDEFGPGFLLDMRNCRNCPRGSTLSRQLPIPENVRFHPRRKR